MGRPYIGLVEDIVLVYFSDYPVILLNLCLRRLKKILRKSKEKKITDAVAVYSQSRLCVPVAVLCVPVRRCLLYVPVLFKKILKNLRKKVIPSALQFFSLCGYLLCCHQSVPVSCCCAVLCVCAV